MIEITPLTLRNRNFERFCREYIIDHCVAAAYDRAGYSPNASNAKRLFDQLDIQIRIAQLEHECYHELKVDSQRVIEELSKLGTYDLADLYHPGTTEFRDIHDIPPETRAAMEGIDLCPITGNITKIKMATKKGALDSLGKAFNTFNDHQKAGSGEITVIMDSKDVQA